VANTCDQCGETCYRTRYIGGRYLGLDCRCVTDRTQASTANPYGDLTIEHVHDEKGNPVRVTSSRQLAEAEKRYNFASVVRNFDQANIDRPPQQKVFQVTDFYREKFQRGEYGRRS